ncbi:MAG: hypothetical protein V4691_05450 [Pseudomonadota bacterium]
MDQNVSGPQSLAYWEDVLARETKYLEELKRGTLYIADGDGNDSTLNIIKNHERMAAEAAAQIAGIKKAVSGA